MKSATVVIPHALTTKFTQIAVASLKEFSNDHDFDIVVVDNSPGNPSIRGISETSLGEGVKVLENKYYPIHACALDFVLADCETPYFFATESDAQALKDHWLDRYFEQMRDEHVAMVGWYWIGADKDRDYIAPCATLYNTKILKRIQAQIHLNDNNIICYGTGLKRRYDLAAQHEFEAVVKNRYHGPFSEQRGFQEIWSFRDGKFYQEPGAWCYYRCQIEYECVKVYGVGLYNENPHVADGTWYLDTPIEEGDNKFWIYDPTEKKSQDYKDFVKKEAYYVHHWGGTVSHNWERFPLIMEWERRALPWWVDREDRIWREVVPESVRRKTLEMGLVKTGEEEREFILNHPHYKGVDKSLINYGGQW